MPRPINIYFLTRDFQQQIFNSYEAHLSLKDHVYNTQEHEIDSLQKLVNALIKNNISVDELDDFYYGYEIPQIGKEFDLLKIYEDEILNIELKSCNVPKVNISEQLSKNKHYLKHLQKQIRLFTVVTDSMTCYQYENETLSLVDFSILCNILKTHKTPFRSDISKLFDVTQFLVSPINSIDKFANNEYFLTQQQEECKRIIIKDINAFGYNYYHITGKPGTGKTLLLYDIGKTLAKYGKTLIIHCGNLSSGHIKLNNRFHMLDILPAKAIKDGFNINQYKYLLVDEAHRIYSPQFDIICNYTKSFKRICVFSSDPEQVLSKLEIERKITDKIATLEPLKCFSLSEKIRTSKELNDFIQLLFNLNLKSSIPTSFPNVDVVFASSCEEANLIKNYYEKIGYSFINFTQSNYNNSPYSKYTGGNNTHHVLGQEFDNVLIILDSSFYYDNNNKLAAVEHPNPDYLYLKLLYQHVTRCRKKLALIIVNNHSLFEKINSIF